MPCLCRDKGLQLSITSRPSSHDATKSRGPGQSSVDKQHCKPPLIRIMENSLQGSARRHRFKSKRQALQTGSGGSRIYKNVFCQNELATSNSCPKHIFIVKLYCKCHLIYPVTFGQIVNGSIHWILFFVRSDQDSGGGTVN